jgi:hypothetical protein
MEDSRFSQSEVQGIFSQIPPRTLLSLATAGVVEWVDENQDGRGVHRIYGPANLYQIAVATQLSLVGFSYNLIKGLVMDRYLKGNDEKGSPKILNYMTKLLGMKIGEEKYRGKRMPLYQVLFDEPININVLVESLNAPFEVPDLLKEIVGRPSNQVQPITILIINLPELTSKVRLSIKKALKERLAIERALKD